MMSVSNFQGVSQYNNEQETAPNLSQLCGIMTTSGKTPYENYVAFNTFMLNYYSMECMDTSWNSTINPLISTFPPIELPLVALIMDS